MLKKASQQQIIPANALVLGYIFVTLHHHCQCKMYVTVVEDYSKTKRIINP
jgi:hypothetical protein